jgi:CheY-like chemotaxis protein/anti-sigma regulatory factor (Ser/Thr protein kinase)
VRADRRRLKQILLNLASNGVKYNRRGGRVTFLVSSPHDGVVRIGVRDTGPGVPDDQLDRLFTPFDRLGAEQTEIEGTGIGLALSQRLAEMMGATLTVESEVGVGSTFSVDVALAHDPSIAAGIDAVQAAPQPAEQPLTGTVLYVEDNPSNLRLVQRIVDRRGGIRLLSAGTGGIALSLAARVPFDLVLLDLHLPDMNGAEVLRRLREQPATARTPIVVVSADASPGQVERLHAAGADAFLAKPFNISTFLETLDDYLIVVNA